MSKLFSGLLILYITIGCSFAQDNPADNKNIGFCNIYSDTLSLDQIKNCETITINSDKKVMVTSYTLSYYLADGMTLNLIHGFGNTITKEDMAQLLSLKPKSIFLEELLGEDDKQILILGHRWFYFK